EVLQEVVRGRLVIAVDADGCVVATEARGTGAGDPWERSDSELVLDLGAAVGLGEVVDVRPVAVEEQLAGLECLPALLLLEGDGLLGDVAVLEGIHKTCQALDGLGRVDSRRLAVLAD